MKKFLFVVLCVIGVASAALAGHDGPFPMLNVVGTWGSENSPGLYVTIRLGQRSSDGQNVQVYLTLEDSAGQVIAEGSGVHNLCDPSLDMVLKTSSGSKVLVSLSVLHGDDNEDSQTLELIMHVHSSDQAYMYGDDSYVLNRQ